MQKKYRGIFGLFSTKGQHNDEIDHSQYQNTYSEDTSKGAEADSTGKIPVELSIENSRDSVNLPVSMISSTHEAQGKQLSHAENSPENKEFQTRAKKLEAENLALRRRLWRMQYRGTIATAAILSGIGGAILFSSYLWSSLILTFIGLGITLWGVLIFYISPSRHVRAELLNSISASMQKCMDNLVTYMGYTGDAIFFHPKSLPGLSQGYVMIPHYAANLEGNLNSKIEALNLLPYSGDGNIPSIYLHPKGMFLAAPSQGLLDLAEKELGINFATVDLQYVQEALPKLFIEELKIANEMSIEKNDDGIITITIAGGPSVDICRFVNNETRLGRHIGCPVCASLALVFSKVSGNPIVIKESNVDDRTILTTYMELGHQNVI